MSLRIQNTRGADTGQRRNSEGNPRRKRSSDIAKISNILSLQASQTEKNHDPFACEEFDDLLELVGSEGNMQKRILYYIIFPFVAMLPFAVLSMLFMLYEPEHTCFVPGKPENMSELEWKNFTIPRESSGKLSQCSMYQINSSQTIKTDCQHGWDYDQSDYRQTLPSSLDWVCTRGDYVTYVLTANAVGACVGTPIYGWGGDKIGRKKLFFLTVLINVVSRGIALFIPQYFPLLLFFYFLSGSTFPMIYILPYTILTEICSNSFRSWLYGSTWMIWVLGICLLPLVAWLCADWFLIGLVSLIPLALTLLCYKMLPESPRWLLSVGRLDEAVNIMKVIAERNETNGKFKDGQIEGMMKYLHTKNVNSTEKTPSFWDLFKRKRLAFYTILLGIVWAVNTVLYYGITLNSTSMVGSQFLNFFYLSIIELPSGYLGQLLAEKTGRRWPQPAFFIVSAIGFVLASVGVSMENTILTIVAVIISKFSVAVTSLIVNLQANEIFPTQLRSTGNGFIGTFAALIAIVAPAIIYLRKIYEIGPYVALCVVSIIGVIGAAYLPETLNQSCLPETIEDSNNLGKGIKFWSYQPKDYKERSNNNLVES